MQSVSNHSFLGLASWMHSVLAGEDVIVRGSSALTYLGLFSGYSAENTIDVYAKSPGKYENVNYAIVDSFAGIDCISFNDILCVTPNYAFNELLSEIDSIDPIPLVESLADYYYSHGNSFEGLKISPNNIEAFKSIQDWVLSYYKYDNYKKP